MAVQIIHNGNTTPLDVLYQFDKDETLQPSSPQHYAFDKNTSARIQLMDTVYSPQKLHLVPKLHHAPSLAHTCELVMECAHQESERLFVCIGLIFDENEDPFAPDVERLFSSCSPNHLYLTKSGNRVLVCSKPVKVQGKCPPLKGTAKDAYKEIIDSDSYDVLSLISVSTDHQMKKVESKTSRAVYKPMLFAPPTQEGFHTAEEDNYMECKLMEPTEDEEREELAVVPLHTSTYERGMVTFTHFLHFFLVTVGAGIGLPLLFVSIFQRDNLIAADGGRTLLSWFLSYGSLVVFFLLGLIIMIVGLAIQKKAMSNMHKKTKPGEVNASVMAMSGFYLILVHCSFALGMFAFKKFEHESFVNMFSKENLATSFYDVLSGLQIEKM
jgi:hypothetical protein